MPKNDFDRVMLPHLLHDDLPRCFALQIPANIHEYLRIPARIPALVPALDEVVEKDGNDKRCTDNNGSSVAGDAGEC